MDFTFEYNFLFNKICDGLIYLNRNGTIVSINQTAASIFNLPVAQLVGMRLASCEWVVKRPDGITLSNEELPYEYTLRTGIPVPDQILEISSAVAKPCWFRLCTIPVLDTAESVPERVLIVLQDVSEIYAKGQALSKSLAEEMRATRTLQKALLPDKLTIASGYRLSNHYEASEKSRDVGGDTYDLFRMKNGYYGLLVADVSGKGIKSVALAATSRGVIRGLAYSESSPSSVLYDANNILAARQAERNEIEIFVTGVLLMLDPESGALIYSGAGHPAPIIFRLNGEVDILLKGALPLAVMENSHYEDHLSYLGPGDKLLLFTDGVVEARRDEEMFGTERLVETVKQSTEYPMWKRIMRALYEWTNGSNLDDIVLLAIERLAQPVPRD